MSYTKITTGHPSYERLMAVRKVGLEACDSIDHNHENGCSNPDCWKYKLLCYLCHKIMNTNNPVDDDTDCGGNCWECQKTCE